MALEGSSHAHDRSEEGVTIWNISSHSEILNVKLILFSDLILMCKMTPPRQLLESSTFASTFKFNAKQSKGGWQQFKHWNDSCKQTQWLVQTFNWLIKTFNWLMQTLQRLMHKSYEGTSICCPSLRPSNLIRWLCHYIKKRIYFINQLVSKAWFKRQPVV